MTRLFIAMFTLLTVGAAYATYHNIGLEDTTYTQANNKNLRSGSVGVYSSGGFRSGK